MPPIVRYTRDTVLSAAFDLVRRKGLDALNARAVAQELGSSTQPIFRLVSGMDELRAGVIDLARDCMADYLSNAMTRSENHYLNLGINYVLFARDETELFKILFIQDLSRNIQFFIPDELISIVQETTGLDAQHARRLHQWLWIFTHGLAVCVANKASIIEEGQLPDILKGAYEAALLKMHQDIQLGIS